MACHDLHDLIAGLERDGELSRIGAEVDPVLEVAAITDRVCKSPGGGPALLFENVTGCALPVATNLFGSPARMARALGVAELPQLTDKVETLLASGGAPEPPLLPAGTCRDVVEPDFDLLSLPALQSWPGDGGRFLTLPLVITADPDSGAVNCGLYRVRLFDRHRAGIHWYPSSGGAGHYRRYQTAGKRMPVAVVLGGSPALLLTASLPLPETVTEAELAAAIAGTPVPQVRCLTSDLLVPADAELVIEGYLEPGDTAPDGLFGNHTGYYASSAEVPVLHVTAVTRRSEAIIPATVVGPPPMEDCWLAKAGERVMLPFLRREVPELAELNFPLEWIFHRAAVVSAGVENAAHGRDIMERLWRSRWLSGARLIILVDRETDPRDLSDVAWKLMNRVDWQRDLVVVPPDPADARRMEWLPAGAGRMGIDATRCCAGSGSRTLRQDDAIVRMVTERWNEYGL
jgi:4-hydroxy-3-polyprenylbenzoate decarboxylase